MLMERASEFRRLRAPSGDAQTLVDPAWSELPGTVVRNREHLAAAEYDLQGRTLADLSRSARHTLLDLAIAFTSQYRDVPDRWRNLRSLSGVPFVLSGHQPELFHPGVWYKNFVLGGLARRIDGVGIHLLIDSDLCRGVSIRVPTGTIDEPRVEAVPYDEPVAEVPYEERTIRDAATFSRFAEHACRKIRPLVSDPMVTELWPLVIERNPRQKNLGLRLAQGRHAFEETWGDETLELPQSAICQMPEFAWFVAHLLANIPRFWSAYNKALANYRRAHRLRGRAQPVPELAAKDGWLEAPFWIWTSDDPQRRPLFARQTAGEVIITDQHAHTVRLPLAEDGDVSQAAAQLVALTSGGIKLRTRALTTTLIARLMLSDLFLHGIGGAKYDQVTDEIVRLFFGIEPPKLATVSATLRLPIEHAATEMSAAAQWGQRLRELRYHPEQFIECPAANSRDDSAACRIIAEKRRWLETAKTPSNARQRHLAISAANTALQPFVARLRDQIERERDELQQSKRAEAILRSREYSFCLYPRKHFDMLLRDPPLS
jgi:hypothetical protein